MEDEQTNRGSLAFLLPAVVFVGVLLLLFSRWMDAKSDAASACRHLKVAVAMSSMYEAQSSSTGAASLPLDACNVIVRGYGQLVHGPTVCGDHTLSTRNETHFIDKLTRATGIAAAEVLERDTQVANRQAARDTLIALLPGVRVNKRLGLVVTARPRPRLERDGQVDAYVLAGWYYQNKRYGRALSRLKLAFGDEWAKNGTLDEWWSKNLPMGYEQHLWIGYVWYRTGSIDRALVEFREVYGSHQTVGDIPEAYKSAPNLVM